MRRRVSGFRRIQDFVFGCVCLLFMLFPIPETVQRWGFLARAGKQNGSMVKVLGFGFL